MSSVYALFKSLAVIAVAIALAECGKVTVSRQLGAPGVIAIAGVQVALIVDGLRLTAPDWWVGAVFWATGRPRPDRLNLVPIPSAVVIIGAVSYLWLRQRSLDRRNNATA
jgi:hypothetical protein